MVFKDSYNTSVGDLKKLLSGWKFMESHKIHEAFVQMAKQMSGLNECCSAPSQGAFNPRLLKLNTPIPCIAHIWKTALHKNCASGTVLMI